MADRAYINGSFFEIFVNRALHTSGEKRPELTNLIYSEEGMSFSGFGSTAKHLEKTKALLSKSLKALIANKVVDKECKNKLNDLLVLSDRTSGSGPVYSIVEEALDLTNKYKEEL